MTGHWDREAVKDLQKRGGSVLGLSGHQDRDHEAAAEADGNGNGRSGLLVRLTVKQVSIALGIVVTLATGVTAVMTREPKAAAAHPTVGTPDEVATITNEAIEKALAASPKYQLDQRRVDELAATVGSMADQVKFLYDAELKRQGAQEERQRRRKESQ